MANLTAQQLSKLTELGKAPINLPAEIYFGGREDLQKSPGVHHLPAYRKTGTYHLPQLKEQRKRESMDRAKRLINNKMSDVELRKIGGVGGLQEALKEHGLSLNEEQTEIAEVNAEHLSLSYEAKRKDREEEKKVSAKEKGETYKEVIEEPVNPKEDILKQAAEASNAKVRPEDDLSSLKDESEKDGTIPNKNSAAADGIGQFVQNEIEPEFGGVE